MTKEKAITIIESHKAHWQRLLREKICDEIEGRETIEGFDMAISALSENKGEWIYDKSIYNWRCSECGETPPPTGYVGKAEFMATHFKFCNYCGADMRKAEKTETCKGCLEPCIMYEADMRACKHKVTERGE